MNEKIRDHRSRRASPAAALLLGLLLTIFLSSLVTEPADAAIRSGHVSAFASCPQLQLKSSGSCVKRLQRLLDKMHIRPYLKPDGVFASQTQKAVKDFQRRKRLHQDGVVGPKTFRALEATQQAPSAPTPAPTPAPGSSRVSSGLRTAKNIFVTIWQHAGATVLAFGGVIIVMLGAAALFGVKSVHITYSRKRVDCDIVRFPPQRIVDTQAEVIRQYMDVQAQHPQQLPPPDGYIRSIGQGG
jgi:peptidoglycan hydrolase-like protein with peptidoglycan-binding domain